MFSQIDYVICLVEFDFRFKTNVIHWSSIKCKWVTPSVFAAKLYAITHDFDFDVILKEIDLNILDIFISLIFCIDSKSLYDCLVQLDTTQKKRLMINVMSLRQSYKRRKITKVKWIHEINNSIDFIIKKKAFTILKTLIDQNVINLNTSKWVERNDIDQ
jgi:hypothetical protein